MARYLNFIKAKYGTQRLRKNVYEYHNVIYSVSYVTFPIFKVNVHFFEVQKSIQRCANEISDTATSWRFIYFQPISRETR